MILQLQLGSFCKFTLKFGTNFFERNLKASLRVFMKLAYHGVKILFIKKH